MADRLDIILVNRGFAKSREKAKSLIKEGKVYINNIMQTKPAAITEDDADIHIVGGPDKYVSRGGYKLEKAIEEFSLNLKGFTCMDIGASTGGFTDCMLKNGADYVYAIDVGHDQLHESLREDDRVKSMEGINFRYLKREDIERAVDFASVDVSFISLKLILPVAVNFLTDNGEMVCLVKPQFEAGREHVNKKGVVKDEKIHVKILREIIDMAEESGFSVKNLTYSPIRGPEGNIEYLMHISKVSMERGISVNAANTVSEAFASLK